MRISTKFGATARAALQERLRALIAAEIRAAFPGASEHETCAAAAPVLGMDPDTVRRHLRKMVAKPDFSIIAACRIYRGVDVWAARWGDAA